jgi:hypothetical protein
LLEQFQQVSFLHLHTCAYIICTIFIHLISNLERVSACWYHYRPTVTHGFIFRRNFLFDSFIPLQFSLSSFFPTNLDSVCYCQTFFIMFSSIYSFLKQHSLASYCLWKYIKILLPNLSVFDKVRPYHADWSSFYHSSKA